MANGLLSQDSRLAQPPDRPCARCGKRLLPHEQFGPDVLAPLCWEHWLEAESGLPFIVVDRFDVLFGERAPAMRLASRTIWDLPQGF